MATVTDLPSAGSGLDDGSVVARLAAAGGVQRVPGPKLTLFIRRGFLPPATCAALIERIDAVRRPSTISDDVGLADFRTSETGDLDRSDPVVAEVEAAIAAPTGLDGRFGEPIQGRRYAVGQKFKGHTDYFEPTGLEFQRYCGVAGNRTWTVMVYMNDVEADGSTRVRTIDKIVQPEAGKLLALNNRRSDGSPNPATMHHGMKVRAGVKYVITKWFREREWR